MSLRYVPSIQGLDLVSEVTLGTTNGLSITSGQVLSLAAADGSNPGALTATTQTIGGDKTFTGTIAGISKSMVGLGNVDNTSDANKPVSTATQTALNLKADLASPTFTGTVSGITKSMVGLSNVDNTSDATKNSSAVALTNHVIDADLNTLSNIKNSDIKAAAAITLNKLAATTVSRALVSDASGFVSAATTTAVEIGYVNGVTSAIQTQLGTKMTNPMSTGGDIIYGGASGTPTRLTNGSNGQVLTSSGGTSAPTWGASGVFAPSQIIRGTAASYGGSTSGETTVINYSAAISSTGSDITFTARTTTTGDKYTINTTGRYAIWATGNTNAAANNYGISINSSGLSTNVQSLATTEVPMMSYSSTGALAFVLTVPGINLTAGDIVRVQGANGETVNGAAQTRFGITRIG